MEHCDGNLEDLMKKKGEFLTDQEGEEFVLTENEALSFFK